MRKRCDSARSGSGAMITGSTASVCVAAISADGGDGKSGRTSVRLVGVGGTSIAALDTEHAPRREDTGSRAAECIRALYLRQLMSRHRGVRAAKIAQAAFADPGRYRRNEPAEFAEIEVSSDYEGGKGSAEVSIAP